MPLWLEIELLLLVPIGGALWWIYKLGGNARQNSRDIARLEKQFDKFDPSLGANINQRLDMMEKNIERLHTDHTSLENNVSSISRDLNRLIGMVEIMQQSQKHGIGNK